MAEGTEAGEAMSKRTAVYDLYLRGELIYVGSSTNPKSRICLSTQCSMLSLSDARNAPTLVCVGWRNKGAMP